MKNFSIVIPIYGNEDNLPYTIPYIMNHLDLFEDYSIEIILVNDGSPDDSWQIMREFQKRYSEIIRIASLTRNFGQLAAWRCGMDLATGDVIGFISADLQDPFELFVDMLNAWENGYQIVVGARTDRIERGISVVFSKIFQKIVHIVIDKRYPKGGFDFFLIDRIVKEKYSELHKSNDLTQLWLLWLGYKVKEIPYTRREREIGKTGYTFFMKVEMGLRVLTVYSKCLINMILYGGIFLFMVSIGVLIITLIGKLSMAYVVSDLIQIIGSESFFTGIILLSLSIIGNILWNVLTYCKNTPSYIIDELIEKGE